MRPLAERSFARGARHAHPGVARGARSPCPPKSRVLSPGKGLVAGLGEAQHFLWILSRRGRLGSVPSLFSRRCLRCSRGATNVWVEEWATLSLTLRACQTVGGRSWICIGMLVPKAVFAG